MRILLFSGSHPRHLFVLAKLLKLGSSFRVVVMERESLMPSHPANITKHGIYNFRQHFEKWFEIESEAFGQLNHRSIYSGIEMHLCQSSRSQLPRDYQFCKKRTR